MPHTRLITFSLGLVLALEAGYWVLAWPQSPVMQAYRPAGASDMADGPGWAPASASVLGSWLDRGGKAAQPEAAVQYRLLGVVAGESLRGSAVIAAAGAYPRTVRVGDRVDDLWELQSVSARQAVLAPRAGQGGGSMTLTLQAQVRQRPSTASDTPGPEVSMHQDGAKRPPRRPPVAH